MKIIDGNLIELALAEEFDVIAHGCNCFCKMTAGIAKPMAERFKCNEFHYEQDEFISDYNKLGSIDYQRFRLPKLDGTRQIHELYVVNAYTQYRYGQNHADGDNDPYDMIAIIMCLKKLNHDFGCKRIGLPYIGCGLASPPHLRDFRKKRFEEMVKGYMPNCDVTIVNFTK